MTKEEAREALNKFREGVSQLAHNELGDDWLTAIAASIEVDEGTASKIGIESSGGYDIREACKLITNLNSNCIDSIIENATDDDDEPNEDELNKTVEDDLSKKV